MDFFDKVGVAVVDGGSAKFLDYLGGLRRTCSVHFHAGKMPQLQERGADPAGGAVNHHALPRLYPRRTMQHLVCRDVVQDESDDLCRVQTRGHWNELAL